MKLKEIIKNPYRPFSFLAMKGLFNWMDDATYLKLMFRAQFGCNLDLTRPRRFNEKLQWLKLYDRKPEYVQMVDKYESKKYFAEVLGSEYIIPNIGVWDSFDEIDFGYLPEKFVLKTTHDSGGVVICKDKSSFSIENARSVLEKSLKTNYFNRGREWPYKFVKPRILAEVFLDVKDPKGLVEYKVFCFNGEPKLILLCKGTAHGLGRTNDFLDIDFNHIPVRATYPNTRERIEKPQQLDEILDVARKLSVGITQLRVDTYVADGKVYIGEATFFHDSGWCHLEPQEWDYTFGEMICLPERED